MPVDVAISETGQGTRMSAGALSIGLEDGALRGVTFAGVEVLRRIDYPVRDADWRTSTVEETAAEIGPGIRYLRRFHTSDGTFAGVFEVDGSAGATEGRIEARLRLTAQRDADVNRAGFVVLHPIALVAGTPMTVTGPHGSERRAIFPAHILPSQPVLDIAELRHRVGPVAVAIAMEGDVFEMEDQRNWTDASFKTYCRPLALPRPYRIAAGETVEQRLVIRLTREDGPARPPALALPSRVTMPGIVLAHEAALCGPVSPAVSRLPLDGVLLRVDGASPDLRIANEAPVTLEIVVDAIADIERVRDACAAAAVLPHRVVALPRGYLVSHQPEGPWPDGPVPSDLLPALRAAFPAAEVGGGMLTNFTEFNRCRVRPDVLDFVTFGTTAIVHAADDASVLETLEALSDVFTSARALSGDRDLRLGLLSIGMRSNPYGAALAKNPDARRIPMALEDPRQRTTFAAAWAVGVAAAAARGGVATYAPAMTGGPLGTGPDDAPWPLREVVIALTDFAGLPVEITGGPSSGLIAIRGRGRRGLQALLANLGPDAVQVEGRDLPALTAAVLRGAE